METTPEALVRRNVAELRKRRGHTVRSLSARLGELGRPILPSGITKIENGERRVDVGDLVALAIALDVAPATLLLPNEPTEDVELTPACAASWKAAWRWANGDQPLVPRGGEPLEIPSRRMTDFIRENRPYETPSGIDEAQTFLHARLPGLRIRVEVGSPDGPVADRAATVEAANRVLDRHEEKVARVLDEKGADDGRR